MKSYDIRSLIPSVLLVGFVRLFASAPQAEAQPVNLSWNAVPQTNISGYNIYRSEEAGVFFSAPLNGSTLLTTTSFVDANVSVPPIGSRSFYYAVTAVSRTGVESPYSNIGKVVLSGLVGGSHSPVNLGPITIDGANLTVSSPAPKTAYNLSIGVSDNPNRVLVVCTTRDTDIAGKVKVDGTPMTLLSSARSFKTGIATEMWIRISPAAGVSIVESDLQTNHLAVVGAVVLNNVDMNGPVRAVKTSSNDPQGTSSSLLLNSADGDLLVDCVGAGRSADPMDLVPGVGQTQVYDERIAAVPAYVEGAMSLAVSSGPTASMTWDWATTTAYGHVAASFNADGSSSAVTIGHVGFTQPDRKVQTGVAFVNLNQNGVLVSEAAFPLGSLRSSGRVNAETWQNLRTGVAITNPNAQPVSVSFFFADANGTAIHSGTLPIDVGAQQVGFLDGLPFLPSSVDPRSVRTFTFSASAPIAFTALRGLTNERSEFLITPLAVADLDSTNKATGTFPYYVEGAGWESNMQLINPSETVLSGVVQVFTTASAGFGLPRSYPYQIAPRSGVVLNLSLGSGERRTGWVRITTSPGNPMPTGLVLLSLHSGGITVFETGVPAIAETSTSRVFLEETGGFRPGSTDRIRSGFSVINPTSSLQSVVVDLLDLNGNRLEEGIYFNRGTEIKIPASGQAVMYFDEVLGFAPTNFSGFLRLTANRLIVIGFRERSSMLGRSLFQVIPLGDDKQQQLQTSDLLVHFFAKGGGFFTRFVGQTH